MSLEDLAETTSGKQLFLAGFLEHPQLKEIILQSVEGGFAWAFDYQLGHEHGSCGSIKIQSEYISACMPEVGGTDTVVLSYSFASQIYRELGLLFLIGLYYYQEYPEEPDAGEEWKT